MNVFDVKNYYDLAYTSLEELSDDLEQPSDVRSTMYRLGQTLLEMLSQSRCLLPEDIITKLPLKLHISLPSLYADHLCDMPNGTAEIIERLNTLISWLTMCDMQKRPSSWELVIEYLHEIKQFIEEAPISEDFNHIRMKKFELDSVLENETAPVTQNSVLENETAPVTQNSVLENETAPVTQSFDSTTDPRELSVTGFFILVGVGIGSFILIILVAYIIALII